MVVVYNSQFYHDAMWLAAMLTLAVMPDGTLTVDRIHLRVGPMSFSSANGKAIVVTWRGQRYTAQTVRRLSEGAGSLLHNSDVGFTMSLSPFSPFT